jgi:hypothetical protein
MGDATEKHQSADEYDFDDADVEDEGNTEVIFDQTPSKKVVRGNKQLPERVVDMGSPDFEGVDGLASSSTEPLIRWTREEDGKLLEAVDLYGSHQWKLVAQHVGTRDPGKSLSVR